MSVKDLGRHLLYKNKAFMLHLRTKHHVRHNEIANRKLLLKTQEIFSIIIVHKKRGVP